jgi:hypothetical protein
MKLTVLKTLTQGPEPKVLWYPKAAALDQDFGFLIGEIPMPPEIILWLPTQSSFGYVYFINPDSRFSSSLNSSSFFSCHIHKEWNSGLISADLVYNFNNKSSYSLEMALRLTFETGVSIHPLTEISQQQLQTYWKSLSVISSPQLPEMQYPFYRHSPQFRGLVSIQRLELFKNSWRLWSQWGTRDIWWDPIINFPLITKVPEHQFEPEYVRKEDPTNANLSLRLVSSSSAQPGFIKIEIQNALINKIYSPKVLDILGE